MTSGDLGIPGLTGFEQIGTGGFASVYSAHEPDAGRQVAVKVLRAADDRARERFNRERRTLGMMTEHPHIVTMFRSGFTEVGDLPYLVMEYMPGGSLEDQIHQMERPSAELAIELVAQVADALAFAHRAGVVHKDIKPANILLTRTGVAKLTDFGISAVRDATGTSQMGFSLAYAPPETFHASSTADGRFADQRDERSDLYSLAATLYALLNGGPPFAADTQAMAMHRILTEPPPTVGDGNLDQFLATALAKDPADRFATADEFAQALRGSTVRVDKNFVLPPSPVPSANPLAHAAPAPSLTPPPATSAPATSAPMTHAPGAPPPMTHAPGAPPPMAPSPLAAPPGAPAPMAPSPLAPPPTAPVRPATSVPRRRRRPWGKVALVVGAIVALAGTGVAAAWLTSRSPQTEANAQLEATEATESADGDTATDPEGGPSTTTVSTVAEAEVSDSPQELAENTVEDGDLEGADLEGADLEVEDAAGDADETSVTTEPTDTDTPDAADAPSATTTEVEQTAETTTPAAKATQLLAEPTVVSVLRRTVRTNSVVELGNGLLATPDFDIGVRIWDRNSPGQDVTTYGGHGGGVTAVATLAGGLIASGGTYDDGTIHIWNPADTGTTIATYTGHEGDAAVTAIHQLRNGLIVSGDARGRVQIWDPSNPGSTISTYDGHASVIITEVMQLRNGLVLTNGEGDGAHVWDVNDPGSRRAVYLPPGSGPNDTYTYEVVELDNGQIASATLGGVVHVWSPERPTTPIASYTGHSEVRSLLGLKGGFIASGGGNGQVHVWDPADPTNRLMTYTGHQAAVFSMVELGNGLIASTGSNEVHLWNPYAG